MTKAILWMSFFALAVGATADVPAPAAPPAAAVPMEEQVLDLTCILPADGPAVERGVLVVRLYEYDPRLADAAATEIGRVTLAGISHRMGSETILRFPCSGATSARKSYYITAVVYPSEGVAADCSGLYFINGFQRVLTAGNRESLTLALTPVGGEGEPTN